MAKIGILGGSFHPFHNGHLALGQYCLKEKDLNEIWFVPTGFSYLKKDIKMLSGYERLHLAELGIEGVKDMKVLDIEIIREGPSYTYETLEELHTLYPDHQFYYIVGADCLFYIDQWKETQKIFDHCILLAAARDDRGYDELSLKADELKEKYNATIEILHFPTMDISSTEIRTRVQEGKSIEDMVPKTIEKEIYLKRYFLSK